MASLILSTAGPGAETREVRASPTGTYLVSFGSAVCVWDGATGALVARRPGESSAAHFSSDADVWLISDKRLVRWSFASGKESAVAIAEPHLVGWGTIVVVWGDSHPPQLLDLATHKRKKIARPSPVRGGTLELGGPPAVSRDGTCAALRFTETKDRGIVAGHLRVIDTATGAPVFDAAQYPDYDTSPSKSWVMLRTGGAKLGPWLESDDFDLYHGASLAFDARGRLLTHLYDKTHVHDTKTGALLDRIANAPGAMAVTKDRLVMVDPQRTRTIKLAPKLALERTAKMPAGVDVDTSAAIGTKVLAVACNHLTLLTWPTLTPIPLAEGHDEPVTDAAFSPDGTLLATIDDQQMIVWNAKTTKRVAVIHAEYGLAFSPDGTSLAARTSDGVAIWAIDKLAAKPTRVARTKLGRGASWIGWSPAGAFRMIETVLDGGARIYEGTRAKQLHDLDRKLVGTGRIVSCALSPDGTHFAAAFADDEGWGVWDLRARKQVFAGNVEGLVAFHDGVAACGGRNGFELVTLADRSVTTEDWEVESFAFSGDGTQVAIASSDRVRIATVPELSITREHAADDLTRVAMAPDGRSLAIASRGGLLQLISASPRSGRR